MGLIVGVVGGLFLLAILEARHQTISSSIAGGALPPVVAPPSQSAPAIQVGGSVVEDAGISAASAALNAIPVVGGAVASAFKAISNVFLGAHYQRMKQATNENTAVDNFIPAFNAGIAQVVNAYNAGKLTAQQAVVLLDTLWQHYWAEVTPVIQPGRNGCNGGRSIDYSIGHVPTISTQAACSGAWGAACCVGAVVVGASLGRLQAAILLTDQTGAPQTVTIAGVNKNTYSNFTSPFYRVTVQRPR